MGWELGFFIWGFGFAAALIILGVLERNLSDGLWIDLTLAAIWPLTLCATVAIIIALVRGSNRDKARTLKRKPPAP